MFEVLSSTINRGPITPTGQISFFIPGTFQWTVPEGVETISVALIAAGASGRSTSSNDSKNGVTGGYGGDVRWKNQIAVVPGDVYTIVVGSGGVGASVSSRLTIPVSGGGASSAFGVVAGNTDYELANLAPRPAQSTPVSGSVFGFTGGGSNGVSSIGATSYGGSAATLFAKGVGEGYANPGQANERVPSKGSYLDGSVPVATGGYGYGGQSKAATVDSLDAQKSTTKGGNGTVRIIWGPGRAFPNSRIGNL